MRIGYEESYSTISSEGSIIFYSKQALLLITVVLAALYVFLGSCRYSIENHIIAFIGKRSYGIFIWHQIFIAFYRYYFSYSISFSLLIVFFILIFAISELTYHFVEMKFPTCKHAFIVTIFGSVLASLFGGYIYLKAGVVRDVPELNIYEGMSYRGMHAEYVDRVYGLDKDFNDNNGKINVLVEGISYGRDMVNVFLESNYKDSINISYIYLWDKSYLTRIRNADFIFTYKGRNEVPRYVTANMKPTCKIWGIGTKNYGQSNGIIYRKRFSDNYYALTVPIRPWYINKNEEWKKEWKDHYIDFIKIASVDNKNIRVFTDDNMFISQDCYHLTQAGAKWYARQINFSKIFKCK